MPDLNLRLQPKQVVAYLSSATEILYGGAAGGGKSYLMRVLSIVCCLEIPGLQVYLFRRVFDDLIKNHVEGSGGYRVMLADLEKAGYCKIVEEEIRFSNGSKIYLCHCKDESHRFKYQGAEIHLLLIDELTLFTETIYRFLRTRVRMTNLAVPEKYKGQFPRIICGSNPSNLGHAWVKATFIMDGDKKVEPLAIRHMPEEEGGMLRQFIPAKLADNPKLIESDPSYRSRLKGLGSPALVRAFEEGDWDAVLGSFLEGVWNEDLHVVDPFPIPSSWKVWRSMDWGYTAPYCILWFAMDHDGVVYVWRELYGWGGAPNKGVKEDATAVSKRIHDVEKHDKRLGYTYRPSPADSAMWAVIGNGRSVADLFLKNKVRWYPSVKGSGSRAAGAQVIITMLNEGKLKIFSSCKHLIRTVPALLPDPVNSEDVDTKGEDHAWDALRYGASPRIAPMKRPDQIEEDSPVSRTANGDIELFTLRVGG